MSPRLMWDMRIPGQLAVAIAMAGCEGNVKTTVLKPDTLRVAGAMLEGVVFYPPQYVKTTYVFTTLVNDAGVLVGAAPQACREAPQKEEITIMPDFSAPMLLRNDAGFASSAKFSVTLNNGMLVSVNSEPTEKLSDVLKSSTPLTAGTPRALTLPHPGGQAPRIPPPCNAGPQISSFRRTVLQAD